jgi:hypothetical protein
MRFFTSEWHGGDMSDEDASQVPARYAEHLASLLPRLPDAVRDRLGSINLHDAQIRECTLDWRRRAVRLALRAGDNQVGYANIGLEYQEVATDRLDVPFLRSAVADPTTELLYDELDEEGGYVVHRLLFWPYQSVDVYFRAVQLSRSSADARLDFARQVRLVELGAPAT